MYPGTQRFSHSLTSVVGEKAKCERICGCTHEVLWTCRSNQKLLLRFLSLILRTSKDLMCVPRGSLMFGSASPSWPPLSFRYSLQWETVSTQAGPETNALTFCFACFFFVGLLIRGFEMQMCCRLIWDANIEQDVTFHKLCNSECKRLLPSKHLILMEEVPIPATYWVPVSVIPAVFHQQKYLQFYILNNEYFFEVLHSVKLSSVFIRNGVPLRWPGWHEKQHASHTRGAFFWDYSRMRIHG